MDSLNQYGESDGSSSPIHGQSTSGSDILGGAFVQAAPAVDSYQVVNEVAAVDPTATSLAYNVPVSAIWSPVEGPQAPGAINTVGAKTNHTLGHVESDGIDEVAFHQQRIAFGRTGIAMDPTSGFMQKSGGWIVNTEAGGEGVSTNDELRKVLGQSARKRKAVDIVTEHFKGISREEDERAKQIQKEEAAAEAAAAKEGATEGEPGEQPSKRSRKDVVATSTFLGKQEFDYQGRSWVESVPPEIKSVAGDGVPESFMPKECVHVWEGHTKGVNAIRWFPKWGHLLLSSSLDGTCRVWDVYNSRKCMRVYKGHGQGVRDVYFNNDGTQFLSASYDRNIRLWDTETGQCIQTCSSGKIPYSVRFYPKNNNEFLSAMHNKKALQWDLRTGEMVQEYEGHLGPVNTVTFLDDDKRFATTSDDKKLYIWEYGIPVVMKHISEPYMHSMPAITVHPNKKWMLCQSLDNQIMVYGATDRFKLHKKKIFRGHITAGYACPITTPPDGRYVVSGDGDGRFWVWDWKTCRVYKKVKAHEKTLMGLEWHPVENSKLATAGWDGLIKFWD